MSENLYLKLKKKIRVKPGHVLKVKDICSLVGPFVEEVKEIPFQTPTLQNGNYFLVDVLDVVKVIQKDYPYLHIQNVGAPHMLVEIHMSSTKPKKWIIGMVWITLFLGSGLAIMNFHIDVNMKEVHQRMYYLITGNHTDAPVLLQVSYSLGIGLGMILFFNHFFKKRLNEEPSPMELEVFLYQESIDQYVIHDEKQKLERKK